MMAAILKAAGKEEFAPSLKMALNSLDVRSEGTPQNVQATKLALERTARPEILQGTQFAGIMQGAGNVGLSQEQLKAYTSTASMYGMGALNPQYTGLSQDQISLIMQAVEAYKDLNTEQQRVALSSATVTQQVDILGNSLANSNIDDFRQSVQEADAEGLIMAGSVSNLASKISGLGEMEKSVLKQFAANSVSAADQLTVLKLRTEGVISDISTLASLDKTQITIYLDYVISQQKAEAARKEAERIVGTLQPKPKSGGASGDSAQKKALQAKLKAIQEEERVEKNIAKLKELQLKYDEKRKKSVVDYLAALEAGDMEGALRAQIQMEQYKVAHIKEQSDLKKEIARDDEKARLQAQIDALEAGNAATNNLSNSVDKTKKEIMSLGDNLVKTFGVNGNIDSAIKQFNDSSELKALVKQMRDAGYTQQDINKFVETLREQIRAAVNAALASAQGIDLGLAGGKGFGSKGNPLPISGITPAGFRTSKDNAFFNKNFLNEEQKRKIVSDYKLPAGAFFEVANEVYRVGNDGDAVRQKNAFERGEFGPDAARGKWAGLP